MLELKTGDAIGAIEVYGWPPFLEGIDAMLKASDVQPMMITNVGVGVMCFFVVGDIGSVRAAVDAGVAAAGKSTRVSSTVLPNPSITQLSSLTMYEWPPEEQREKNRSSLALGALQTEGLLANVAASDAILRSANVQVFRWQHIGLRCHTLCVQGDVGDISMAIEVGVSTAKSVSPDGDVYSAVLSNPDPVLLSFLGGPPNNDAGISPMMPPLGVLECASLVASAQAADSMFKAARISPVRLVNSGSGWITSFVIGELGSVQAAIETGRTIASKTGPAMCRVFTNPSPELLTVYGVDMRNEAKK